MEKEHLFPPAEQPQGGFPQNLLLAIKGETDLELPMKLTKDVCAGILYVLSTLEEREQEVLWRRYLEKEPCGAIGDSFDLLAEQVSQIEATALKKLRIPSKWNYIRYGIEGHLKKRAALEYSKGYQAGYRSGIADARDGVKAADAADDDILNLPLEGMNLSARAYNCLHYGGYKRIRDIVSLSEEKIWHIKNLGRVSANEIAKALQEHGILHTAWSSFLEP